MEIVCYHGTDETYAKAIIQDEFKCKHSNTHWLGNGIYFFTDCSLAKWWTSNPTKKFSSRITKPAIIACEISVEEGRVLNLCTLAGFEEYVQYLHAFFDLITDSRARAIENVNYEQIRCAFFNYMLLQDTVDMIIAPFLKPDQPYFPPIKNENLFNNMHIMYTEVQVCLKETRQDLIQEKRIIM